MFQVKYDCYWNKPKKKKIHSPHQHGNSAIFLCIFWQTETGRRGKILAIRKPNYRGLARKLGARCAVLLRAWVQCSDPVSSWYWPSLTLVPGDPALAPLGMYMHVITQPYGAHRHSEFILKGKRGKENLGVNPRQIIMLCGLADTTNPNPTKKQRNKEDNVGLGTETPQLVMEWRLELVAV